MNLICFPSLMYDCYELGCSISKKKMKSFIFSKEHRGAYLCPTFIERGALSSNTVLIAFEGFNLVSIFFLPICITFKGFVTFLVNYYICGFNTHILNFIMILRFGRSE